MDNREPLNLIIDTEFRDLIRPLRREEYLQLESNLNTDGCRDPLIVWNGVLIDGHNRYEICTRLSIPFNIKEIQFESRDEAIAWICTNQLGRRNITEETRRFLIGRQYEAEKVICNNRNPMGKNQYTKESVPMKAETDDTLECRPISSVCTAKRIGSEYNISHGTVQKYAAFATALDTIGKKEPAIVTKILSGSFKISHENLIELSTRSEEEIKDLNRKMERAQGSFVQYSQCRKELEKATAKKPISISTSPSVKDMPDYDPDVEIAALSLTVPSWERSVIRAISKTNFKAVSEKAKCDLQSVLHSLLLAIDNILTRIEED